MTGSALVKAGGPYPAYGIVHQVTTQGVDPSRRPVARGVDEATEEDVYRSNPQLSILLRTDFQAVIVGHSAEGDVRYFLPPAPPPIYAFVHLCNAEEVAQFISLRGCELASSLWRDSCSFLGELRRPPLPLGSGTLALGHARHLR